MQFKVLLLTSLASVAVAQSSTACAAQNIVDSCVATIQGILNACDVTDYTCKCTNYGNIISSCYAACPNLPSVSTYQSLKAQNCAAMSAYGTTTVLKAATSSASTAMTTSASTSTQSGSASGSGSRTSSASTASSSSHNGAQAVGPAGGFVALVAAGVAALL